MTTPSTVGLSSFYQDEYTIITMACRALCEHTRGHHLKSRPVKEESNFINLLGTIFAIRHPHSIVRIIILNTTMNQFFLSCLYNPSQDYDDNSTEWNIKIIWNPACSGRKQFRGVYDVRVTFASYDRKLSCHHHCHRHFTFSSSASSSPSKLFSGRTSPKLSTQTHKYFFVDISVITVPVCNSDHQTHQYARI